MLAHTASIIYGAVEKAKKNFKKEKKDVIFLFFRKFGNYYPSSWEIKIFS